MSGATLHGAVPAFPGAAGGGAKAVGGRGGRVVYVTNLNDSGAGSLRACLQASGARNCLFKVSGIIHLSSPISITNPFVTVWGQSAPGGGIEVTGFNTAQNMLQIYTHDVVLRYLRIRAGYNAGRVPSPAGGVPMKVGNASDVYNLVIDHCSLTWSSDKQYTAWTNDSGVSVHDATVSWSILGQGVQGHSTAINIGSDTPSIANGMTNQDFHHNLILHHDHRNPLFKGKSSRFVNNIVYNWGYYASMACGGAEVDFIGNYYKPGAMTDSGVPEILIGPQADTAPGSVSMYVAGNIGPGNSSATGDNWRMVGHIRVCEQASLDGGSLSDHKRASPLPAPDSGYPIPVDDAAWVRDRLTDTVGPYQRIDENGAWVPNRDFVDSYLVSDYRNGTGRDLEYSPAINALLTDNPPAGGAPCTDSDGDGISNDWETARGLNPNDASDGARDAGSGYTWLEVFLNGGAGAPAPVTRTATLSASLTTANPGQAVTVSWTAVNPQSSDTIALFAQGAAAFSSSQGTAGAASGSWTVNLPSTLGTWEFRYLSGGTTVLARSAAIAIVAPPPVEPPPPADSPFVPIRVNAGGQAFTDGKGAAWAADTGFAGGYPYSTTAAISGTTDDALYQSEHYGMSRYQFAVPNGNYQVNLRFAEIYFTASGQRVFDVSINGAAVLPNFDIVAASGARYAAVDKSFAVSVAGGQIAIEFTPKVQNAKISAIEILKKAAVEPIRVNAGGAAFTDSQGRVWSADASYSGGYPFSTTSAIDGTTDDALYQTERYGSSTSPAQYQFTVPNGAYRVNLKFAEIYHTAANKRVFDVLINGQKALASFDPFAAAGARYRAVDRGFDVNVTNGRLAIQFGRITGDPKISAIEILPR